MLKQTKLQERIEYFVTDGRGYNNRISSNISWWPDSESKLQTTLYHMDVADGKQKIAENRSSQEELRDTLKLFYTIGRFETFLGRDDKNYF